MLKVLLVEDEFVVREGIKKIDWGAYGYEFCGEASDGELALPLIRKTMPDIVITDIKMPFMDGLELTRQIRREFPDMEIIILSGYEEFEYARDAISLGVSKYLSKPIGSSELIRELDDLKESIEQKKLEREMRLQYQKDMSEDVRSMRRAFFKDLVGGNLSVSQLIEEAEENEIDLVASAYCILLCNVSKGSLSADKGDNDVDSMYETLGEWSDKYGDDFLVFERDLDGVAILFKGTDAESIRASVKKHSREFAEIMSKMDGVRFYAGIGSVAERVSEISTSFENASKAFAHRYFDPASRIVTYDPLMAEEDIIFSTDDRIPDVRHEDDKNIEFSAIDINDASRNMLLEYLRTGDETDVDYFVREYLDQVGGSALNSLLFRQYLVMDVYFTVAGFVTDLGFAKEDIEAPDSAMTIAQSIDGVRDFCIRIISAAMELRDSSSRNKYKDVAETAVAYIEEHYMDEDLSLNTLAEHVRFSPNHLSMIFSQQMGVTFSKYLIEYRIGKAKEALKCTSMKSSEIALEVGYRDPHYFSYMFKKITGQTPTQYREGK